MNNVPDIVIITGLSGSGMSSATNAFQDLGYFCVDNLPITMLPTFGRLVSDDEEKGIRRAALVIDIREGGFLADFEKQLDALRALGLKVSVVAEIFGVSSGIGYMMNFNRDTLRTDMVFVWALALIVIMLIVDKVLFEGLSRRVAAWR